MYHKEEDKIWIATGDEGANPIHLLPKMSARHGLVTGATGTGKTTTIKVMAEAFSQMGTSVFLADIKGDVSGLCKPGVPNPSVDERLRTMGITDFPFTGFPVRFFDVYGATGIPLRTTVSGMGPLLLARILGLNETQTGVLQIISRVADDNGLLLLDFKDLRSMAHFARENGAMFSTQYGNVPPQSVGAIQRRLFELEEAGAESFFGEPELDLRDWFGTDELGRGVINVLDCTKLFHNPLVYSTFLLWMLSELYETMPEVGDLDRPKMVFFFDEAHLLFSDIPKALLTKIEQIVRLIRSKGVGVYFITQTPADIPGPVLAQLGNKIQHALRAYTPNDHKAIKAAAASFRPNPAFDAETVISELATGEALVSALDEAGAPGMVQRGFILPPQCSFGVAEPELIEDITKASPLYDKYHQSFDRHSAYEALEELTQKQTALREQEALEAQQAKELKQAATQKAAQSKKTQSALDKAISSSLSQIGRSVSRELVRGIFGTPKR